MSTNFNKIDVTSEQNGLILICGQLCSSAVRQPVALSSALTRFGMVLRHVGAFDDAARYFVQLQNHALFSGDLATEAIAYHNLGLCSIG